MQVCSGRGNPNRCRYGENPDNLDPGGLSPHDPDPDDIYWLIEVSNSTLAYDLGDKAGYYAQDRIQEYWVVDIPYQTLWCHRQPKDGRYNSIAAVKSGTLSPLSFPGVSIEVS